MSSDLVVWFDSIAEVLVHAASWDSYEVMEIIMGKRCHAIDVFLFFVSHVFRNGSDFIDSRIIERERIGPKGLILCYARCRGRLMCTISGGTGR